MRRVTSELPSAGRRATPPRVERCGTLAAARKTGCSSHHLNKETVMAIKVGDRLPDGTLTEFIEQETPGCTVGPNAFQVSDLTKGKKIVVFGLPGAFTPTCSAKHVPSYVANIDKLRSKGVDEVWCISVNDAFVMGAWAKDQKSTGKVRMMADGSAALTKAMGLEMDLTARGMGVRSQRYSMLVDNGVVKSLNVEAPGKFEVSDADTMLKQV
jgi:glutaredoxin/glutathione-dependent peroxiredoxin